jgi:hypothetical protein
MWAEKSWRGEDEYVRVRTAFFFDIGPFVGKKERRMKVRLLVGTVNDLVEHKGRDSSCGSKRYCHIAFT